MSIPVVLLIMLLLATALAAGTAFVGRERAGYIALAGPILLLAGLLAMRLADVPAESHSFPWAWAINDGNGWLSAAFTLLVLVSLLVSLRHSGREREIAAGLLLLAATMSAIWADSPAALVTTWTALGVVMWLVARLAGRGAAAPDYGLFWLAPLLLWLAVASMPQAIDAVTFERWGGPAATEAVWLLAAFVAIGAFPFNLWRSAPTEERPAISTLLVLAPATAGAVVVALLAGGAGATRYALPLTLVGLLGLLWAAYDAWRQRGSPHAVAMAVVAAEASLLVLLAVWGDQAAASAEARVLLLAGGAFLLAAGSENQTTWERLALIPAFAAVAAFPLTAGFAGRGVLYSRWLESGNWLLIAVVVLLQVPLLAAGATLVWPRVWPPGALRANSILLLLPALGLVSWQAMSAVTPLAWGPLALQLVAALLLFHYGAAAQEWEQALQQALAPKVDVTPLLATVHRGVGVLGNAMRDAAGILEGSGGLLWVLFFLIVIWLAR